MVRRPGLGLQSLAGRPFGLAGVEPGIVVALGRAEAAFLELALASGRTALAEPSILEPGLGAVDPSEPATSVSGSAIPAASGQTAASAASGLLWGSMPALERLGAASTAVVLVVLGFGRKAVPVLVLSVLVTFDLAVASSIGIWPCCCC